MRSIFVIMGEKLGIKMIEMRETKDQEFVETFLPHGLDESFDEGV